jgi:hypothetical protein
VRRAPSSWRRAPRRKVVFSREDTIEATGAALKSLTKKCLPKIFLLRSGSFLYYALVCSDFESCSKNGDDVTL